MIVSSTNSLISVFFSRITLSSFMRLFLERIKGFSSGISFFGSSIFSEEPEILESAIAANLLITFLLEMTVNF